MFCKFFCSVFLFFYFSFISSTGCFLKSFPRFQVKIITAKRIAASRTGSLRTGKWKQKCIFDVPHFVLSLLFFLFSFVILSLRYSAVVPTHVSNSSLITLCVKSVKEKQKRNLKKKKTRRVVLFPFFP